MSGVSQKEFSMKNNKILLAILAIALVLGMIACSNGSTGGGKPSGTTPTPTPTPTPGNTGNWKTVDSPFSSDEILAIAYGSNKFVVGTKWGKMATSPDGVTWTPVDVSSTFTNLGAIIYANNKFAAVGGGKFATSPDGINWTVQSSSSSVPALIAYGNGTWVAGGSLGNMAYSTDGGVTWTAVAGKPLGTMSAGIYREVDAIAYGNGTFVAVSSDSAVSEITATSADGITWTTVTDGTYGKAIAFGNGKFVAVRNNGKIATSTDGTTWTPVTTTAFDYQDKWGNPKEGYFNAIIYEGGKFVAGGSNGKIATSPDGTTWTAVGDKILGTDEYDEVISIGAIAYGNGTVVVVSYRGDKMAYSTGL
jgi:hypothetical protein